MAQNSAKASSVQQVSLDNLTDVVISSVATDDVLTYNGSVWVNQATQGDMLKSVYDTDLDGVVDSAEKEVLQVRNATGSPILKGKVVYINNAIGQMPTITLADADTEVTSSKTIGLTLDDISNNSNGYIITSGIFHNVDTGAFSDGNTLWLSSTAGDMVATSPPAEPAHAVFIGYVAYAHNTNGKIVVAIQNGYELDELHGVKITTPVNNDTLKYDSVTGLWINSPSGTVTSVGLTTGTSGTDVNVSGSTITGSGSFTLNIPTASSTNRGVLSTTDWSTFNSKQGSITLTTTGTSGAATLIGNTLNIPQYSGTNIYNSDGTLSSNRVVTMGGNTINFSGGNFGINTATFNGTNPERFLVAPSNQINAIVAKGSVNDFMQLNIQNTSNGSNASSDVVATSNNGTDLINYIDMGINGGNYSGVGSLGVANDAYLYSAGRELYIGNTNTASTGNIKFFAGNATGSSIGMTLTYQNRLGIGTTSPAEILDVNGKAKLSQLQVTTGAANRYVLTSDASGNATWDFPPVSASEIHRGFYFSNNSTTVITEGGLTQATTATVTAQSVSSTSFATKQIRLRFAPTIVATGQYCGTRGSALLWFIGGGFRFICDFSVSDTAYGSTCQQFYGLAGQTTDLVYGGAGTTAVSTLTNIIGLGNDAADTNLQIIHNDAAGTATKVDLGASFPANRTAGAAMTTVYSFMLYSAPAATTVNYQVINQETGAIATGTLNTNLPLATQGLNIFASRAMGTPTTNTGQFDLNRLGCYSLM